MGLTASPEVGVLTSWDTWQAGHDSGGHETLAWAIGEALGAPVADDATVALDVGTPRPIEVHSKIGAVKQVGARSLLRVALYHWVSGGPFGGDEMLFVSCGYGQDMEQAIWSGGRQWGELVGPVLRAAAGLDADAVAPTLPHTGWVAPHRETTTVGNAGYLLVCNAADRGFSLGTEVGDWQQAFAELRLELAPGQWLAPVVVASRTLPPLAPGHPSVLHITVVDTPAVRSVEIAVNGHDWPVATAALRRIPGPTPVGRTVMLQEAAVLVPL